VIDADPAARREAAAAPGRRQLLFFGLLMAAILLAIGLWPLLTPGRAPRPGLVACSAAIALLSAARPGALATPFRAWMRLGHVLGAVSSRVVLTLLFFVIFLPVGLAMRVRGRDPLRRRFDADAESYLQASEPRDVSHMDNPF